MCGLTTGCNPQHPQRPTSALESKQVCDESSQSSVGMMILRQRRVDSQNAVIHVFVGVAL